VTALTQQMCLDGHIKVDFVDSRSFVYQARITFYELFCEWDERKVQNSNSNGETRKSYYCTLVIARVDFIMMLTLWFDLENPRDGKYV